ncbi:GWT1-domain-containing protein [Epithele typhae]|uniref:GWT1-domain-containing protein n=1 Tax=Epithele typhae TaxID=378194 RepID=UPI0020075BE9|nr:GWT1-domain-containing protein [Epithele typhae]KAH9934551.1 GWT1-domain-containing protein [Epithele typhae]
MSGDYKAEKEAFVSGMTGSSIGHINMVSLVSLASIALHSAARTRIPASRFQFLSEATLLILPILLSVTLFADSPGSLCILLAVPTALLLFLPARESGTYLPSSLTPSRQSSRSRSSNPSREPSPSRRDTLVTRIPPLPALTTYRAHMLLLTFICILAVDFEVFPRFLAKCETYGVSLMDIGVGSFVFSQGIVSAIPLVKNPTHLTAPLLPKVTNVLRKCSPLLLLGLLRTMSVKGTEYPEHVTEYGVHWNFFVTLAMLPILQVLLHPLMVYVPISLMGVVVAVSHQLALSSGQLDEFILHAPRESMISANKEGLISLPGYLAIHLLGLSTGTLVLAPSPSYFRRRQQQLRRRDGDGRPAPDDSETDSDGPSPTSTSFPPRSPASSSSTLSPTSPHASAPSPPSSSSLRRENDKTATELCSYAVLWWVLVGALWLAGTGRGVSRRMANLPYVVWIAAFNSTFLLGYLVLDIAFFPSPMSTSVYSPHSKLKVHPGPDVPRGRAGRGGDGAGGAPSAPPLLEAVNKNGLVLFLLANVTTGLVNLSMQTMYMSDWAAMMVLTAYSFGIGAVAWTCRHRKLWRF